MNTQTMQIVKLEPLRVASAWAFGPQPEGAAWEILQTWAQARGLLHDGARIFGFNNPSPAPGSPNYGYEYWLEVGPRKWSLRRATRCASSTAQAASTPCWRPM
jgi:hypothetical protein